MFQIVVSDPLLGHKTNLVGHSPALVFLFLFLFLTKENRIENIECIAQSIVWCDFCFVYIYNMQLNIDTRLV